MRKICTFLLTMVLAIAANAAIVKPSVVVGDEFTSAADLAGKSFAIVDKAAEKALFGSNNQNLAFDAYGSAFVTTNSGYTWQLESLAENEDESVHGYYLLHLVAPNGTPVPTSDWGGKYLNSQDKGGWCCFNLGITAKKLGQDIDYGAVWDVQFVEGKGFSLKNIGTGLYKGADGGTANKEEAVYFAFVPVSITYAPALKELLDEGAALKGKVKDADAVAAYEAAVAGIDAETSEDALADCKKVDAAIIALAKAQAFANGTNFTRAIVNPSFEVGSIDGWTSTNGGNSANNGNFAAATGGVFVERWTGAPGKLSDGSLIQEITGLPNGLYMLSAEMQALEQGNDNANGTGYSLVFNDLRKEVKKAGETVSIMAKVTDGKLTIGTELKDCSANWVCVDNFQLMAVELEKWYTDNTTVVKVYNEQWYGGTNPNSLDDMYKVDASGNGYIEVATPAKVADPWDSQIFISVPEALVGKKVVLTMKVKASKAVTDDAQTHASNDGTKYGKNEGTVSFGTEWKTVVNTFNLAAGASGWNNEPDQNTIVLNLSQSEEITYCFDEISIVENDKDKWFFETPITENGTSESNGWKTEGEGDDAKSYYEIVSKANGANPWSTQAFIFIPEDTRVISKKVKFTANVWADADFDAAAQAHLSNDGNGYHGELNQKLHFTANTWTPVEMVYQYPADYYGQKHEDGQLAYFVLNICDTNGDKPSHTYRFDDVKFQRIDEEDWFTNNVIVAKDPAKDYEDGKAYDFPAAKYVFGTGPEAGYAEVVSKANPANAWASQVFFSIPASLAGKAVDITMYVKASKAVTADGQLHTNNKGDGYTNAAAPKMPFTTEWVKQTVTVEPTNQNTYVLNLANDAEAITYDFDSLAFALHPVDYKEPVLEETEQWYQDLAAQGIQLISRGEPGYTADAGDKSARYIKGDGTEGDYLEYVSKSGVSNTWESQVFIYLVDDKETTLPAGTEITVTMKVKASEAHNAGSQAQQGPGGYLGGGIPEIKFTTDWTPYTGSFTVPADGNSAKTNCFSLDLGNTGASNITYYFDEVVVTVEPPIKKEDVDWADDNLVINGNLEGDDMSSFIGKIQKGHDEVKDGQPTGNYIYDEMDPEIIRLEAVDLKKNAKDEAEPKGLFLQVSKFAPDPADETKFKGVAWDSQLWIRLSKALPKGTVTLVEFDYKATNVSVIASQTHNEPGEWVSNDCIGSIAPSSEWQHFEFVGKIPADLRSIAFNLGTEAGGNYRFDNFVVKIAKDAVDAVNEATKTADAATLWAETLALNEAAHKGKTYDTEGYTEESVKALTDAVAAGKKALAPEEGDPAPTKESLSAATKDIEDAIAGLKKDAPALAYTDLTQEMFFQWSAADGTGEAINTSNCDLNLNQDTDQIYGLSTVDYDRFADLSEYSTIEVTTAATAEFEPRLLFNRIEDGGTVNQEVPRDAAKFETVVDNEDGTKTYIVDLAAIVAEQGYAHLHAIKRQGWSGTTNVTAIKLGYVGEQPSIPVVTAIEGVETAEDAVKDGKYFINGQIVIVKNGVKYNAAGVAIQ